MEDAASSLSSWLGTSGLTARGVLLLLGGLLLVLGARNYRAALILPAAALGAALVDAVLATAVPGGLRVLAALVGAVATGVLAGLLESVAVRLAGVLLGGGLALALWPAVIGGGPATPWWVPLVGGFAGLAFFPGLYRAALRVVVPLLGALIVTHALGRPGDLLWVLGLAAVGFVVDSAMRSDEED